MESFIEAVAAGVGVLAFIGVVGFVNERLIEKFVKPITGLLLPGKQVADYVALLVGLVISLGFQIDLLTPLAVAVGLEPLSPWFGLIVTGLGVGGGANFWHDVWPKK